MNEIKVMIVDDHQVVREGTRQILESDPSLDVVSVAGNGAEAIALSTRLPVDVVMLDLALPDMSGIEVAGRIQSEMPLTHIVILSAYDDDDYVMAAMEAGVEGYLLKTMRAEEIIDAIHAVVQGELVIHPAIARKLQESLRRGRALEHEPTLSSRELEVLRLAAKGMHNREIAGQLYISVRTVEGHFSRILNKLDLTSRTEAVVYGLAHGWYQLDGDVERADTEHRERWE